MAFGPKKAPVDMRGGKAFISLPQAEVDNYLGPQAPVSLPPVDKPSATLNLQAAPISANPVQELRNMLDRYKARLVELDKLVSEREEIGRLAAGLQTLVEKE